MNLMTTLLASTLLAASLPVFAQAPAKTDEASQVCLSAGLIQTQGNALDMTGRRFGGFTFEAGAQFRPEGFGPSLHAYVGYLRIPGAKGSAERATYDLAGPRFGLDLQYQPVDRLPLKVFTGPVFHIWQVENTTVAGDARQGDQSLKPGWRLGAEYAVTPEWAVAVSYTLSAWRSLPEADFQTGVNPSRPAYLTFSGRYRF